MDDAPGVLYLEADDEVTSVIRRLRSATEPRLVVVAPGRSRATSSTVALRLLARVGSEEAREIAIVGDPLTRSLAAEAGLTAYATVDDARQASVSEPAAQPRRAGIHVVRGAEADEAAPTIAAAQVVPVDAQASWAETRPMPAAATPDAPPRRRATGRFRLRRAAPLAIIGAAAAVLLLAGGVAAAILLPAATVTVVPRSIEVGPRTYTIPLDDAEHLTGTVEETATVTATGTYPILVPATGVITFFNWNVGAVEVPVGTLVAAGEQAFETLETIVVPSGRLTPDGRIQAGEGLVGVVASAPGPAGNVPSEAIDTVLSQTTAARLRGFQNNASRLVINYDPTVGGLEEPGQEITQADVAAAVESLREAILDEVERQVDGGDRISLVAGDATEPTIEGLDGLVGARDRAEAEIRGTLAYDRWLIESSQLDAAAAERLGQDDGAVPDGFGLSDAGVGMVLETTVSGDGIQVTLQAIGRATAVIDEAAIAGRIRGLDPAEARAALSDVGRAQVHLWPDWIGSLPQLEWRIQVVVADPEPADEPEQAATAP